MGEQHWLQPHIKQAKWGSINRVTRTSQGRHQLRWTPVKMNIPLSQMTLAFSATRHGTAKWRFSPWCWLGLQSSAPYGLLIRAGRSACHAAFQETWRQKPQSHLKRVAAVAAPGAQLLLPPPTQGSRLKNRRESLSKGSRREFRNGRKVRKSRRITMSS